MAKIYIETYGCTLNQADSDIIKGILSGSGHVILDEESKADIIIINTCTVKGATECKIMERLKRLGSGGKPIVIAGCMVVGHERIREVLPDAVLVWPSALEHIGKAILAAKKRQAKDFKEPKKKDYYMRIFTAPILRVPIGEGCKGNCHFCQTKLARPALKSYSKGTILEWISRGVQRGAKEIQITAMDCGSYGMDNGSNLVELLESIVTMEGDFKVRLGMINPEHVKRMKDGLIKILNSKKMYKFMHMPVQSGSNKVCLEMNRDHSAGDFEQIAEELRKKVPGITIATDIIVGYPTETADDFRQTVQMIGRLKPEITNLSKFSARPGTKAKEMMQLSSEEIKKRSVELSDLIRQVCKEDKARYVGRALDITITENKKDFTGITDNYKQVVLKDYQGKLGDRIKVKITEANHSSLFGEIIKEGKTSDKDEGQQ